MFDLILLSCSSLSTFVIKYGICSVIGDMEWDQGKGPVWFSWAIITEFQNYRISALQTYTAPLPGGELKSFILVKGGRLFHFNNISNDCLSVPLFL